MKYQEYLPHTALRRHVKCFWVLERPYTPEDALQEVLPDACMELIFNFGAPYVLCTEGQAERPTPRAFLVGLQKHPLVFRCDGVVQVVAARFYAWGALPFLAEPQRAPGRLSLAFEPEWGELAQSMEGPARTGDYDTAVAQLEDALLERLLRAEVDSKRIQAAARLLYLQKGQVRVSELAEACGLSTRQLERQFQDATGVPPKTLARAVRFDAVRERLMFDPDTSLAGLAQECGYTDQAHFIRDFKEHAGKTPGEFAQEMRGFQAVFRGQQNVVFLPTRPPAPG